ncbi:SRPBCC family protein [Methylobacterium nodulans]|uniref:Activator of Hsp90 ATPase 1 family protein n=1 Tax=Methylobacterium nodulans (strain LMG 21967 / CNCM I-2342 / ORS 2060) TaxID=460265 RepID=B8IGF8_METNO|nr:SRPBCC family protein [Methylobacterium nodulans]ACL55858.1 Activator of Hsp90 ATPase 1 family protein [Methylobacterium nodulans ORS 2060]
MDDAEDCISKVVELAAPVSRVWRALTDHVEFGHWFRVKLDGPFRPGEITRGRITYPGYEGVAWAAKVERMDRERLFAFSWHPFDVDATIDVSAEPTTLVEFRLEPIATGTRLTITESGFAALTDPRRLEALRSNRKGWDIQAGNIAQHVTA